MLSENIFLSVVIPAYNEETRIKGSLEKIHTYLDAQAYRHEIIVVDDGSTDNTVKLVKEAAQRIKGLKLIKNGKNRGKGFSIKNGFLNAKGEYLLFSDADLSTPIEELEKLIFWLKKGHDIVIGSRGLKESDIQIHQAWYRELMGKAFNLFVQAIAVPGIKDTQCGFKCLVRNAALAICKRQRIERFSFDIEMLYIAKKFGYKTKEVPICWFNNPHTKVSILKDGYRMCLDLIKIRINDLKGKYY